MVTTAQYKVRAFALLIPFFIVLVALFMPWYPGPHGKKVNGLDYFDNLFNEVSKVSAFGESAQQEQMESAKALSGQTFKATVKMKGDKNAKFSPEDAARTAAQLLTTVGLHATAEGEKVAVEGDLGAMMKAVIEDSTAMFNNQSEAVQSRYGGLDARKALFTWHQLFGALSKSQDMASSAKILQRTMMNAIEPAFNYYGVDAQKRMGGLAFAVVFYLVYTVWYGFGIMYLFQGLGIKIGH